MPDQRLSAASGSDTGGVQLYQSKDGHVQLKVRTDGDTVWLTRQQMAALFGRDVKTIASILRMHCMKNSLVRQLSQNLRQFSGKVIGLLSAMSNTTTWI